MDKDDFKKTFFLFLDLKSGAWNHDFTHTSTFRSSRFARKLQKEEE